MKKTIYFAHPITMYGSKLEGKMLKEIDRLGFDIENPNQTKHSEKYKVEGMEYFTKLCRSLDACVYTTFPDGSLGAGVVKEINVFLEDDKPVFFINYNTLEVKRTSQIEEKALSVDETRLLIKQLRLQEQ